MLDQIRKELSELGNLEKAKKLSGFFVGFVCCHVLGGWFLVCCF